MSKLRIISRLDVKGPNVVKGINLEGLRVVGNPAILARKYYEEGADELLYVDIVASLYERNSLLDIIKETTSLGVFMPITVGGGIRTLDDIRAALKVGADKVAINTAAIKNPQLIKDASEMFGSANIVGSIEAKKIRENYWEAYFDNGREKTGIDAVAWAKKLAEFGAGELLITSVDKEGVEEGYDIELLKAISNQVSVPCVASGGAGSLSQMLECAVKTKCAGISVASLLHYDKISIPEIKSFLQKNQILVRPVSSSGKIYRLSKSKKVSVIDTSLGNISSVANAFSNIGADVSLIYTPEEISRAEYLVLPGVGSFSDGMDSIRKLKAEEAIKAHIRKNNPFFGICLGMQLLMEEGTEFGRHKGLGIIKGEAPQLPDPSEVKEEGYRLPHIGWDRLIENNVSAGWKNSILSDLVDSSEVYFVHSYVCSPKEREDILAETEYGGQRFCSAIKKDNIYGCQFHPEKSGAVGQSILYNFLK
ncbi:MAG: imidazole glycerol phosphate synthase subunit HisH [Nanoarchaeota archaeon]|nr:imidazole glycerol phosphate synthase subunit HisH [Nanoarchaeota archaeon]